MTSPKKHPRFLSLRRRFKATPPARHTYIPGKPRADFEASLVITEELGCIEIDPSKWNDVVPQAAKVKSGITNFTARHFSLTEFVNQLSGLLESEGINASVTCRSESLQMSSPFGRTSKITARWNTPEKRGGWVERPICQKLARALKA